MATNLSSISISPNLPVEGGEYVKEAKIGRAVMDADVFVSLTHFKGHEQADGVLGADRQAPAAAHALVHVDGGLAVRPELGRAAS